CLRLVVHDGASAVHGKNTHALGSYRQARAVVRAGANPRGHAVLEPVLADQGQPAIGLLQALHAIRAPIEYLFLVRPLLGIERHLIALGGVVLLAACAKQDERSYQCGGNQLAHGSTSSLTRTL